MIASLLLLFAKKAAAYRPLPRGPLIVGYATQCNATKLLTEVSGGCNVLIWFSLALKSVDGVATITGGPDPACVRETRSFLDARGYGDVAHMISIGGWDAVHPNSTVADGAEWWQIFEKWNNVAEYDGIDWDVEGNDDLSSAENVLPNATLTLMFDMSKAAKDAGALVSLVPAQSYFDPTANTFDYKLNASYNDWHPDFPYRGTNTYTPLVVKNSSLFDFVSVQFYESWSRCGQAIEQQFQDPAQYLADFVRAVASGWTVDFGDVHQPLGLTGKHNVSLDVAEKLVLGFSTGSKMQNRGKMIYVAPNDVRRAYLNLAPSHRFRGCMFWNTKLDSGPNCYFFNGTNTPCALAKGYNAIFHVRPDVIFDSSEAYHHRGAAYVDGGEVVH